MGCHGLLGGWHLNSELSIVQNALVGSASERWWPKLVGRAQFWFRTTSQGLSYWTVGLILPTAKFLQTMSSEETETGF